VANKAAQISLGLTAFCGALSVGRPISWALDTLLPSGHDELRDADQIIGDDVDEEIASHAMNAAMFGPAHGSCCLPQPKMHSIILRPISRGARSM
jgi:hypothetical protein